MDKIQLKNMEFYAYHGVLPEENRLGQSFKVDMELFLNLAPAGQTDDLTLSINYAEAYKLVKRIVEEEQYKLIEALAERIAQDALDTWTQLEEVLVKLVKPNPPIAGHYDYVAVEIRRKRS
ncbi:dihydroneopterin aldolase [Bacillus horti]|uniref:7,8-dihydroneopterin aldolase n=1 Tax=Caldalkalibacillus horti TaxID=77523 RepID=A0ABT9W3B3_9BACI|nr:dihydroneopterin aldolase [Bacillus horti]MDQ0167615.1 dihydroneopterin aldolase [Bacillus horti]